MLKALLPMKIASSSVTLHRDDCETVAAILFVDVRSSREELSVQTSDERGANLEQIMLGVVGARSKKQSMAREEFSVFQGQGMKGEGRKEEMRGEKLLPSTPNNN